MSRSRACATTIAALVVGTSLGGGPIAADRSHITDTIDLGPPPFGQVPFGTDTQRKERFGRTLPDPSPSPAIRPVRDITGVSYYVDAAHSVADPALKRQNQAALAPLHAYVARMVALADGWDESRPANPRYRAQLFDSLVDWARGDALRGTVNQQGEYERTWALGSLALAYLRVYQSSGELRKSIEIEQWLGRVAGAIQSGYARRGRVSRLNNHACWAALAVGAVAVATRDRRLFDWSLSQARVVLAQVRADGFLPLELERRKLALHYHLFALAPLVMLAELGRANGVDLYNESSGALKRLGDRVIAGLGDPAPFAAAAGVAQEIKLPPRGPDLAWAEIYFARFHDPRLAPLLAAARPLRDDRLGGNMTLAFGVPDLK